MPALPHLTATEVDNVVNFVDDAGRRTRRRGAGSRWRARRGARRIGRAARAHRRFGIGVGEAGRAAGGAARGAAMPYPEGTPDFTRYTINEYNTVGNRIKPPFTVIVKYDLNQPGDQVADSLRRRSRTRRARHHRHERSRHSEQPHRHRVGPGVRCRPRQPHSRLGQRPRPRAVVVRFRRQFHWPDGDVRDGRPAVPAGACSGHRRWRPWRRRAVPASAAAQGTGAPAAPMGWVAYALPGK